MKLYKDGQLVGGFSTTELKELAGVDIEKAADVAAEGVSFKVGDKVKIVGESRYGRGDKIGETGEIRSTYYLNEPMYTICENDGYVGTYPPSSLELIKEEPEEVLSQDNVKAGEYFVITDSNNYSNAHAFDIGEIVKAKSYADHTTFKAEHMDESDWWYVYYTNVRRATATEIAEATKPKFEIGDAISVNGRFALILSELDSEHEYKIKWYSDGGQTYAGKSYIRHATEEEKSHLQTLIGREKDEYKVGDLVELLSGAGSGYRGRDGYIFEVDMITGGEREFIHLKDNGNKPNSAGTHLRADKIKLITPVEWRHDFVEEVK